MCWCTEYIITNPGIIIIIFNNKIIIRIFLILLGSLFPGNNNNNKSIVRIISNRQTNRERSRNGQTHNIIINNKQ